MNSWPCKLHSYDCPCRDKTCTQDHPGTCIYFDTSSGGRAISQPSYYSSGSVHGLGADTVAADIMQYAEMDIADNFDEFGFGGGELQQRA